MLSTLPSLVLTLMNQRFDQRFYFLLSTLPSLVLTKEATSTRDTDSVAGLSTLPSLVLTYD